jgi:hypothetical protein
MKQPASIAPAAVMHDPARLCCGGRTFNVTFDVRRWVPGQAKQVPTLWW